MNLPERRHIVPDSDLRSFPLQTGSVREPVQDSKHPGCVYERRENEIRAAEKEISFWKPLSQTRMMYCCLSFFKTGFFASWLLDSGGANHHAAEPVVFIHTSDTGEDLEFPKRASSNRSLSCFGERRHGSEACHRMQRWTLHFCRFRLAVPFCRGRKRNLRINCELLD